jgi:outer membrane protein OmpA-like peptidoglycan-associated protein
MIWTVAAALVVVALAASSRRAVAIARFGAVAMLALPLAANAGDFSLKIEPGVSIPLTAPQSQIYGVGGGQSLKALFGLTSYLDIGPSASFMMLPATASMGESGVAWGFGAGLRLKRPHDAQSFYGISPWLDADALYVRTGALNRPGFDAAVGLAVPIGDHRNYWVGPFVRYMHIMQPERAGYDNHDAKVLTVGVSVEFGSGVEPKHEALALAPEIRTITKEVFSCPDRDGDGVPDGVDHCPDVAGPMDNWGCPAYKKVTVTPDKLELKEKLFFAWDESTLEAASFPVLDDVVQALKDHKGFRVQVDGHTDSTGTDQYNQGLSERRAASVVAYLTDHGIATSRLTSKGFSFSEPIDTNGTVAGRENNRRVEFLVSLILIADGSAN